MCCQKVCEFVDISALLKQEKPLESLDSRGFIWRRRRDSNPRDPFGAYTISNRARSTKLRDFSVFALANLVAGDATLAIIAGLLGMSREKWKKDVTFL